MSNYRTSIISLINPAYYWRTIRDIAEFVKRPTDSPTGELSTKQRIIQFFVIFVIKLVIVFIVSITISIIVARVQKNISGEVTSSEAIGFIKSLGLSNLLLIVGLLAPLLEEAAFRLFLRYKSINLSVSVFVLIYYFMNKVIYHTNNFDLGNNFLLRIAIALFAGIICFIVANRQSQALQHFWQHNFRWIFYFSCVLFALVHISSYGTTLANLLLLPVITLPQLLTGICYGYGRIKLGFVYGVGLHALSNTCMVLLGVLAKYV